MSDHDFTTVYQYFFKQADNYFHIKYQLKAPNDSSKDAQVSKEQQEIEKNNLEPYKGKAVENSSKTAQQIEKQRFKKKKDRKILQMKEEEIAIFKNFNKTNHKKVNIVKVEDSNYKKAGKKKNSMKGQNRMEDYDEDDEVFGNFYEVLKEGLRRDRKSKSIDDREENVKKTNQTKKFYDNKKQKILYEPYVSIEDIEDSREDKEGRYFKGQVDFGERIKHYARIFSKEVEGELITEGLCKNRCLHGDEVYFEILQKKEKKEDDKDAMSDKIRCKVVAILPWKQKGARKIVGKIQFNKSKNSLYLVPINKRITTFDIKFSEISQEYLKKVNEKYFLAEYTGWKQSDVFPGCRILSQYGELGQIQTETGALLINNGVEDQQYSEETIKNGLKKFIERIDETGEYKISKDEIQKRADLREETIFTIDPLTARDFDDALSISHVGVNENNESVYEIGVHIADASFFVEEGGMIDEQAQKKTTSVYLVHRVLPMLPRLLCQTMCSLNPGLQRLTLSVWFKITENGEVLPGSRYDRSVIHSKARFTYQQAQKIITGEVKSQKQIEPGFGCIKESDFEKIAESIRIMNKIAMKMRKARIEGGALIFEIPKKTFQLDENYFPKSYTINKRFEANFLVEEYMLLANQKVGEILVNNIRPYALLRKHQFPGAKKILKFQQFTTKIGHKIKVNKQTRIQDELNKVILNPKVKQCVKDILNYEIIFLLEQAEYFIVGDSSESTWVHYALNMPIYTHFTSPIRRYPDIIVHRQLCAIIAAEKLGLGKQKIETPHYHNLKTLVDRCNRNKMSAKKVSSGCEKIFLCLYLKSNPVSCKAVLTQINQYCLNICVPTYDFRSAIQLKELKKMRMISLSKDSADRKFMKMEFQYEAGKSFIIILKEMQEVEIRLTAKEGFPIDYMIRLVFPHPERPEEMITYD